MTRAVHELLIGALLLGGARAGGQGPDSDQNQRRGVPTGVTLTSDRPTGYFPLDAERLASAPPILALRITRVVNPGLTPFEIFVYLSYPPGDGRREAERILIGNFGLYPPDRPAGFLLRASTAFRKLKTTGSKPTEVRLLLEMRRIHPKEPWTTVEVDVAPPEWRDKAILP